MKGWLVPSTLRGPASAPEIERHRVGSSLQVPIEDWARASPKRAWGSDRGLASRATLCDESTGDARPRALPSAASLVS